MNDAQGHTWCKNTHDGGNGFYSTCVVLKATGSRDVYHALLDLRQVLLSFFA